jgi:glyoxylase-like metal-dependent hydrolase (beta-lactamase superfamily II)
MAAKSEPATPGRVVTDSMIGLRLPDYARHSARVATVLGKNPSPFTGPGTNTYLLGIGGRPILLDTGQGVAVYPDLLARALKELSHATEIDRIVLTHAHVDHIGGVRQVRERLGPIEAFKKPWPGHDQAGEPLTPLDDESEVLGDGVTLIAVFTPGHSPDHLCYYLREERALFTGDVVLGAGTTVIPEDTGDLGQYMDSLKRLLELDLETIYPAHGPVIREPKKKIREYIAHRELREDQILNALADGPLDVAAIVKKIYTDVPEYLHLAAGSSVRSHLKKLRGEGRVTEHENRWRRS